MSDNIPKPIDLTLNTDVSQGQQQGQAGTDAGEQPSDIGTMAAEEPPVMGWIAATCGFLSIFLWGIVFVPLGMVCSVIALCMGQGMWAFIGLSLSLIGLATSPVLLSILGLGFLIGWLG